MRIGAGAAFVGMLAAAPLLALPAGALDPERHVTQYKHTAWTVAEGAPPITYSLAQGKDGYLWIASSRGLYRFDGASFEAISMRGASFPDRPTSVLAARDGAIWVGYRGGDVAVYRQGVLRLDASAPRTDSSILDLVQTLDGAIWARVFRPDHGLLRRVDGRWEEVGPDWGLPAELPESMLAARSGSLWLTTERSVLVLRPGAKRFQHVANSEGVGALSEDPSGAIWLSDRRGTRALTGSSASKSGVILPTPGARGAPFETLFDRDGNLWGLNGEGLFWVRAPGGASNPSGRAGARTVEHQTAKDGLTADSAAALFEDREGNIWVGTTLGLDQFRTANVIVEPQLVSASSSRLGLLAASDGTVYVGTSHGVYRVAAGGEPQRVAASASEASPICEGGDGSIWVFLHEEILRIRQGRVTRIASPDLRQARTADLALNGCARDDHGVLWVNAANEGLFTTRSGSWRLQKPATDWVAVLAEGKDRAPLAWMHSGALVRLDATGLGGPPLFRRRSSDVHFVHQGQSDLLLGGVFGLGRLRQGTLQAADPARFPWLHDPYGLVETPEGQTWLIGGVGIVGLDTAELDRAFRDPRTRLRPTVLSFEDGLPNVGRRSQTGVVRGGDGRLWFATAAGAVWVDPARIRRNTAPVPVTIRALVAHGVRYRDPTHLVLPKGTSSVAIQYTGLSLAIPGRVRFRHRLEGVEDGWVDEGSQREAMYANLGPRTYRFDVIAANNDGMWNHQGATLTFTIPPTFLQSIWFKMLCAIGAGILLWLLSLMRVRQVEARLQSRFEVRMAERERIARELHDTLLQSFQGLTMYFQSMASQFPPESDLRVQMEKMLDRADTALIEGRDRIRELRSEAASEDLAQALRDAAAEMIGDGGPRFQLTVEGSQRLLRRMVGEEVLRIAEEACRNTDQHAGATVIDAVLTYGRRGLRLTIHDNGVGIPQAMLRAGGRDGHYGLVGMRERAEQIGGRISMTSRLGEGTKVTLWVPARAAYSGRRGRLLDRLNLHRPHRGT